MPLLGGANSATPHLSDGIGLAPIERNEVQRSCLHDGFSVAEPTSLVFKNGDFPEAAKKTFGNSNRNPTAGITGEDSTTQFAFRPMNRAGRVIMKAAFTTPHENGRQME